MNKDICLSYNPDCVYGSDCRYMFYCSLFTDHPQQLNSRGRRNKNPFNIRRSKNPWQGKIPHSVSSDTSFEQFENFDYGLRAGVKLLMNYIRKHGCNTPRKILYRFAPACENDMDKYLWFLEVYGVELDKPLKYPSKEFAHLCSVLCWCESSYLVSWKYIYTIIRKFSLY